MPDWFSFRRRVSTYLFFFGFGTWLIELLALYGGFALPSFWIWVPMVRLIAFVSVLMWLPEQGVPEFTLMSFVSYVFALYYILKLYGINVDLVFW